ncbi:uncharacterized protein BO80DRAFT_494748 [Aspergillus ibericus CBS 121593]|uniref:Zn(2)-C6 fungal-type domain-containing protein n=1 Tax=Aspergillus ibericus CBS 121593 TaxID=1448316 RepID=A0A395GV54_9EURO|nr:hypothetical protein BO80DRAFT_494748 [Aspergillus ibericus CBS 121593]RAK99440.1 hypothetical protein BO80DRAFT_494748 [Aspergillus ibericus CBS 121593]
MHGPLGERSCHLCNRKKIRCSKTTPCNHCVRLGLACILPRPFVFGYLSLADSLREYHPTTTHSLGLWQAYEQNVAPVVTIFHRPSLHRMITRTSTNSEHLDPSSEAVVFAVYFAAATSMRPEDSGFLQSPSLSVIQAAVPFLTCLRDAGDADFIWTMVAAVHRLAQGLGLHRDGTHFGLAPFETEMRWRLWWSIYLLDTQSSDYDTRLSLNIKDSDIALKSTAVPEVLNRLVASPKPSQLFLAAVEVVEFAYLLETDLRTSKWPWLFGGYMQ